MEIKNEHILSTSKQAFIVFAGLFIENILKYLFTVILGRSLGAGLLGIFFIGMAVVSFVTMFSKFGMDSGVIRYSALYQGRHQPDKSLAVFFDGLKISLLLSVFLAFALALFAEQVSFWIFRNREAAGTIRCLSLSVPLSTFIFMSAAYFQASQKIRYQVYLTSILQPVSVIILFLCLLLFLAGLPAAIISYLLSVLITAIAAIYFLSRRFGIFDSGPRVDYDREGFKRESGWLFLIVILGFLIRWSDSFILAYFRGANEVGVYNVAIRIAAICGILSTAFIPVFAPVVSKLHDHKEKANLSRLFKFVNRWILSLTLPVFVPFVVYSREILSVFGKEFVSGQAAFIILSASFLFVSLSDTVAYSLLAMTGNAKFSFFNNFAGVAVSLTLNFLLIPRYGIAGAAVANAAAFGLMGILTLSEVYVLFRVHPYHLNLLRPLAAGGLGYLMLLALKVYFRPANWYTAGGQLCLFLLVYAVIIGLRQEDRLAMAALKKKMSINYNFLTNIFERHT